MDKKSPGSSEDKQSSAEGSPLKKIGISLAIGAILILALVLIFKPKSSQNLVEVNGSPQEIFQGPAELNATVLETCQESGEEFFRTSGCREREQEYLSNAEKCLQVLINPADGKEVNFEGYYGDLAFEVVKCYQKANDPALAVAFLERIAAAYTWEVYIGPVSCDSASVVTSYLDSLRRPSTFRCIKTGDFQSVVGELKNGNFKILLELTPQGHLVNQGILEADVSCPEPLPTIIKNIEKSTGTDYQLSEMQNEAAGDGDIFLELSRADKRILNLHFRVREDGCVQFDSLLAPSLGNE
jgi:hypothetical protein